MSWQIFHNYSVTELIQQKTLKIERLRGTILHLDEILTMSARMGASTGEPQWEARYRRAEIQVNAAIKTAMGLAPNVFGHAGAEETNAANEKLIEMEHRAFDWVHQGKLAEAKNLLFSKEYQTQKDTYAQGMEKFDASLVSFVDDVLGKEERNSLYNVLIMAGTLPLWALSCWVTFRIFRKWKNTLVQNCLQLDRQSKELSELNRNLDQKVKERTQEIGRLVAVLESTPDLIGIADYDGKILYVNRAGRAMAGLKEGEDISKRLIAEFHPKETLETIIHPAIRTAIEHGNWMGESILQTASGQEIPISQIILAHRDDSGKLTQLSTVIRDISNLKKVSEMKNEFISVVSHELRTPLTSIRGSLGLIAGGIGGALSSQNKTLVSIALNNCERLVRLINDILDIEKIESGNMELNIKPLQLGSLVQEAVEMNRAFAEQYGVHLVLAEEVLGVKVQVQGDNDKLLQVMTNLISNAAKFSPGGGTVKISLQCGTGRARISINDEGHGIPVEFRSRIFQKFAQVDSSNTRKKGGTGLGLNISKAIIEQHGGQIGFECGETKGTTFYFELSEWDNPLDGGCDHDEWQGAAPPPFIAAH